MKTHQLLAHTAAALLAQALLLMPTACTDSTYDLSRDIDATMTLGAAGLPLKLGSTEKIMLADVLTTDDNLHTDASSTYYLVEDGHTETDFTIGAMTVNVGEVALRPGKAPLTFSAVATALGQTGATSVTVPASLSLTPPAVTAAAPCSARIGGLGTDVRRLVRVEPIAGTKVHLALQLEQTGTAFALRSVKDLRVTFPAYIRLSSPTAGRFESDGTLHLPDLTGLNATSIDLGEATLDAIEPTATSGVPSSGAITLRDGDIKVSAQLTFGARHAFTMQRGQEVTAVVRVTATDGSATAGHTGIARATGRFAPHIDPAPGRIEVSNHLPDFLRDEAVTLAVANPTLKLSVDQTDIPLGFHITAAVTAMKAGTATAAIDMPATGQADVDGGTADTLYFFQDADAGPFVPDGKAATGRHYVVPGLSRLIRRLPDYLNIDTGGGRITARDETVTLRPGHTYTTALHYELLVPFRFETGLRVVHTDSVTGMNKELQRYAADGVTLTADVVNAIPLALNVTAEAADADGRPIAGITVTTAKVAPATPTAHYADSQAIEAAAQTTPVTIRLALADPTLLHRLDRLRLRITADSGVPTGTTGLLSSLQYLVVHNLRLHLNGAVVADFN